MSEKQPIEIEGKLVEYNNIKYCIKEEENKAIVMGLYENQIQITIPRLINDGSKEYETTCIFDNAFYSSKIKSVKIPSSITSIGKSAFAFCYNLEVFEIPNDSKLQTIEKDAFSFSSIKRIIIPSSVTSIGENAFNFCRQLEEIIISDDSKLQTIEKGAFCDSKIKSITIPSELIDLKENWCYGTPYLTKITVSPTNPRYCFFDEKMIIGKTNINQDNYDCLVFCVRDIKHVQIPNFIKHICSSSFHSCTQLDKLEISPDSKLQTIGKFAFYSSTIKSIIIPSSVTLIGENAFSSCKQLEEVIIPNDSKLQKIGENAFFSSTIKSITIPSELIELEEGWCLYASKLTKIKVSPTNPRYSCYEDKMIIGKTSINQDNYDCLIFCVRNIKHIQIPYFIEHICSYSFNTCNQLDRLEFTSDSKLQTIEKLAFCTSTIKSIIIPSSVTLIGESAFLLCEQLEEIIISDDSKLQKIEKDAFCDSKIKSITIPSELIDLKEDWCYGTPYLTKITISPTNPRYCFFDEKMIIGKTNINQDNYDCLVFCIRDIKHVQIPNFIKHICSSSFDHCYQLDKLEFTSDSKLQTIGKYAFYSSTIKSIEIPRPVTLIEKNAFSCCKMLQIIEINNRGMISIYEQSFKVCKNSFLMIPIE